MSVESQGPPRDHINVRALDFFQLSTFTSSAMDPAKPAKLIKTFNLSPGLDGQDERLDVLQEHYSMLQKCTVDCANPDIDLLTFALSTHSFSVVMMTERTVCEPLPDKPNDSEAEGPRHQDEKNSFDAGVSLTIYWRIHLSLCLSENATSIQRSL